jgi:alpha-methylacyl-CoA racemase
MKPLAGLHIVEFEGLGPGPLCGRMLADFGARVTLVVRPGPAVVAGLLGGACGTRPLAEGKTELALNLKDPADVAQALALLAQADGLIEGNRPGVMERLGLGPEQVAAVNPRLVYGRMTGWGQDSPLAQAAGHDLNYVALSGLLSLAAHGGRPPGFPPTLGDGAGALGLAFGIVSGILQARSTGKGCVVDAAITDVVAMLGGIAQWVAASGGLGGPAPSAFHDSPFYDTYRCSDGSYITVGALEPQFYALLLEKLGLHDVDPRMQYDAAAWPVLKARFTALFASEPRKHWCALLEGTDACFAPVLTLTEAAQRVRPGVRLAPFQHAPDSRGAST